MIVTPDFLDHWKTQLLIGLLDDPAAPCYLLRLWAHCQNRKTHLFEPAKLNPSILKAITRSQADKEPLWEAFIEAGFLVLHEDETIEAHGFNEANAQLTSNWGNGKKGGRPPKEKPTGNPTTTHPEPKEGEGKGVEKNEKQDETGEEESARPFSAPSRKQAFWHGKDYSKAEIPEIKSYEDLHRIQDPIIACMAVSGDRSKGMYGFLVKGLQKSLDAKLSEETLKEYLFKICARLLGEKKAGERNSGKIAAALVAEMKGFFDTI